VAEHRNRTVLTHSIATRFIAFACLAACMLVPTAAHAASTQDQIDQTRQKIDDAAQRFFDAQKQKSEIDAGIAQFTREIEQSEAEVATAQHIASKRALEIYKQGTVQYVSAVGKSAMDSARRAELIDHANAQGREAIDRLNSAAANLRAERSMLLHAQKQQAKAVEDVAEERAALDAQLASLQAQALREARVRPVRRSQPAPRAVAAAPAAAATQTAPAAAPTPAAAPPQSGVSPHHDEPFLVCTRRIESGGNYAIVSADGVYYGAYQFLPSTWNATASHAGRLDLIGVLPSQASPYDQDEMAWALYQWQGNGPWGGRC
jgi:septal ring factor EnvC (AmiA/AmiB activator)